MDIIQSGSVRKKIHVSMYLLVFLVFLAGLPLFGTPCFSADTSAFRFFRTGDGYIHIRNAHTGTEAKVYLFKDDGLVNSRAIDEINSVFGLPKGEAVDSISLRLIFLLDYFSDRVAPGKLIHLQSGYRSPAYNTKLKNAGGNVATTSTHIDGTALDFYIDGVDGKKLWEIIRHEDCCGVGHYGGKGIHLDAGKPRFWQAATSKVGTGESDFNRRIYLSTDYDRYVPGEQLHFVLSSVSNFGFGVQTKVRFIREGPEAQYFSATMGHGGDTAECILLGNRKDSRSLAVKLPHDIPGGRYRLAVDFCQIPFPQMPKGVSSNVMEVVVRHEDR